MTENSRDAEAAGSQGRLILGIDTCGPAGTVALARLADERVEVLGQTELEGRTYSETLVASVAELLAAHGAKLEQVSCIVVVHGPGSFTGVRIGLSAAKGFSDGAGIPLVATSRLAVLAHTAGTANAALDAHRDEVFLRIEDKERLAGRAEMTAEDAAAEVAVFDDAGALLMASVWPGSRLVRVPPPTAVDAIRFAVPLVLRSHWDDTSLLDGHYLRRSDAEIFGEAAGSK